MISLEIHKPRPTIVETLKSSVLALLPSSSPTAPTIVDETTGQRYHYSSGMRYMEKVQYTRWLENVVRPRFPIGSYVTMRNAPYVLGKVPAPLFVVDTLQEMVWMAPVCDQRNEPRCILVRHAPHGTYSQISYPPSSLRLLTKEELALVDARNQEASAAPTIVDISKGEQETPANIDNGDYAG